MTLFLTDTEREQLRADLAKAEHLAREHARLLAGIQATLAGPPVDMLDDPLAAFRLPSGAVAYETTYADQVAVGDWVQRCHGDPDWHLVTEAAVYPEADDGRDWCRIVLDGDACCFWQARDAITCARKWASRYDIRRATPAADVVAAQERKAEAGR